MASRLLCLVFVCASACGPASSIDICGKYPSPDPCRPGGLWDPVLESCAGYMQEPCFQCFRGEMCKELVDPLKCQLVAQSGNPLVVAEYWLNISAKEPCTTTIAHYRSAYQESRNASAVDYTFLLPPLLDAIHQLHNATGNVDSTNYYLVGAFGATMVMHAIVISLSERILAGCTSDCPPQVDVFAQRPYYPGYEAFVKLSPSARWNPDADPTSPYTIEIVTSPNNPTGQRHQPLVPDPSRVVWDMVYYWPMFTNVDKVMQEDIMVFSSSKHDGLAGTRFGWGLIRNVTLAKRVHETIDDLTLGISADVELRVLTSIQSILSEPRTQLGFLPFHQYSRLVIADRFKRLAAALSCVELTNYPSSSTGAYAWVRCPQGVDCAAFFQTVRLAVLPGTVFGASLQYARITMLLPSVEFAVLLQKVTALCS